MKGSSKENNIIKEFSKPFRSMQAECCTPSHSAFEGSVLSQIEMSSCAKIMEVDFSHYDGLIARLNKPNDESTESVIAILKSELKNAEGRYEKTQKAIAKFISNGEYISKITYKVCELQIICREQVREHLQKNIKKLSKHAIYKDLKDDEILNLAVKRCDPVTEYFTKENIGIATISAEIVYRIFTCKSKKDYQFKQIINAIFDSLRQNYIDFWTGKKDDETWNINSHYMKKHPAPKVGKGKNRKPSTSNSKNLKENDPILHFAIYGCTKDGANFKNTGAVKVNESKGSGIINKCIELIDINRKSDPFTSSFPERLLKVSGTEDSSFVDTSALGGNRLFNFNHATDKTIILPEQQKSKTFDGGHPRAFGPEHPNTRSWRTFLEYSEDNRGADNEKDRNPYFKMVSEIRSILNGDFDSYLKDFYQVKELPFTSVESQMQNIRHIVAENTFAKYPNEYFNFIGRDELIDIANSNLQIGSYVLADGEIDGNLSEKQYLEECAKQVRPPIVSQSATIIVTNNE